tara:strand:+ start:654 stop:2162 length:1509 start_codon:yes stop_codon:yes gene_type:complete
MSVDPKIGGVSQRSETAYASGGSTRVPNVASTSTAATVASSLAPIAGRAITSFFDNAEKNKFGKGLLAIEGELIKNQHLSNPERRKLIHDKVKGLDYLSDSQRGSLIQQVKERKYKSKTLADGRVAQIDAGGTVAGISGPDPDPFNSISSTVKALRNQTDFATTNSPGASKAMQGILMPMEGAEVGQKQKEGITGMALEFAEAFNDITGVFDKANRGVMGNVPLRNEDDINASMNARAGKLVGRIEILGSLYRSPQFVNHVLSQGKALTSGETALTALKVDTLKRMEKDPTAVRNMGPNATFEKVAAMFDTEIAEQKEFAKTILSDSPGGLKLQKLTQHNSLLKTRRLIIAQESVIALKETKPEQYKLIVDMDSGALSAHLKAAELMIANGSQKTAEKYYETYFDGVMVEHSKADVNSLGTVTTQTHDVNGIAAILKRLRENGAITRDRGSVEKIIKAMEGPDGILSKFEKNSQSSVVEDIYTKWINDVKKVMKIYEAAGVK